MCKPPYKELRPWSIRAYVLEYAFQWALHLCVSSRDGPFAGPFGKALWAFCRFFWKGFYGPLRIYSLRPSYSAYTYCTHTG